MNRSLVRTTLAATLVLASAGAAQAQEADSVARRPGLHLLPSVGTMESSLLGWEIGGLGGASMGEARAYGLGAEVRTPLRGVDLRAGLSLSVPRVTGQIDGDAVLARARITTLTVDAVVRGPRLLDLQPYVLAGAGLRHYHFGENLYDEGGEDSRPVLNDQLSPVLEGGAGVMWDVGRYDLYLEGSRQFSYLRNGPRLQTTGQAENTLKFGLRIPIH